MSTTQSERPTSYLAVAPEQRVWDFVVVGAGLGGAVVGSRLARAGRSVLFIEKGHFLHDPAALPTDGTPHPASIRYGGAPELQLRGGRWPQPLTAATNFGESSFHAPLGCGTGGSSTLYAAQMERLHPSDFEPRRHHPQAADSTVPEAWPVSHAEMSKYYSQAEAIFSVCGTQDPLQQAEGQLPPPPPMSRRDAQLFEFFESRGLHPYRAHVGCKFVPGCENCGGHFCAKMCKQDAGWACLLPALQQHDAKLLPDCEVLSLEADRTSVKRLLLRHAGGELAVRGHCVILAAGALMSPTILLRTRNVLWPRGLGNSNDLVGRNLMLHTSDMVAVKPRGKPEISGPQKSIALNDFYFVDGIKLGTFQTMGVPVNRWHIHNYLLSLESRQPAWWRRPLRPFLRPASWAAALYYKYSAVFATIVEDLPYADNRVLLDPSTPSGVRLQYNYREELAERNRLYRRFLRERLGLRRIAFLSGVNNLNFGHACGTCRFGENPRTSVLDPNNKVHGLDNLYVADASFMPSSGGTNPSLTIAANALRVADKLLADGR